MDKHTMTLIITLICAAVLVGQIILLKLSKAKGWTIRIRPFHLLACAIVVVLGIYSMISGNYILK